MEKGVLDTTDDMVSSIPPVSQTAGSASNNADSLVASGEAKPAEQACGAGKGDEKKGQEVKSKQQERNAEAEEMENVDGHMYSIINRGDCRPAC